MSNQQPEQERTEQLTEQERELLELLASDDLTPEEVEAIHASQQMPSTPPPDDPDVG